MGALGQYGKYYGELADRLFKALEWQYKKHKDEKGHERECAIILKTLDHIIADSASRDITLEELEAANKVFQEIRDVSYEKGKGKYDELLEALSIEKPEGDQYSPQLYGAVEYDPHADVA